MGARSGLISRAQIMRALYKVFKSPLGYYYMVYTSTPIQIIEGDDDEEVDSGSGVCAKLWRKCCGRRKKQKKRRGNDGEGEGSAAGNKQVEKEEGKKKSRYIRKPHVRVHRDRNVYEGGPFRIVPVPVRDDNYAYLVVDVEQGVAVAIDPVDPQLVLDTLEADFLLSPTSSKPAQIRAILTTHGHWDHSAGNVSLRDALSIQTEPQNHKKRKHIHLPSILSSTATTSASSSTASLISDTSASDDQNTLVEEQVELPIYGGQLDFGSWWKRWYTGVNRLVDDGDLIKVGRMVFRVVSAPWHTKGHVMYYFDIEASLPPDFDASECKKNAAAVVGDDSSERRRGPGPLPLWRDPTVPSLFAGDAFFVGGVGKFFEGTSLDLHKFIRKRLKTSGKHRPGASSSESAASFSIGSRTLLWPGHEYAYSNLSFAREMEPGNMLLQFKYKHAEECKLLKLACVPSTLEEESQINPFLRIDARFSPFPSRHSSPTSTRTFDDFDGGMGMGMGMGMDGGGFDDGIGGGRGGPQELWSSIRERASQEDWKVVEEECFPQPSGGSVAEEKTDVDGANEDEQDRDAPASGRASSEKRHSEMDARVQKMRREMTKLEVIGLGVLRRLKDGFGMRSSFGKSDDDKKNL
ncbi:hypothetical protein HK102_003762 [Quaeritorhiza haematococci]|nr:hypothetical protein HK102_003762 [Quaeritorhiza haematococci]